jgi:hypothetical protein
MLTRKRMRRKITNETWEQIKTGYAAGINLREIARKMNIPEGTVLAHAKRRGWTQQIQVATHQQSDAITPVQSVPQSLASILNERKERTKLGLSKFAAEAAEEAGQHPNKLGIAAKVRDVSAIHSSLWPEESSTPLIEGGILIGTMNVIDERTGHVDSGPDKGKFIDLETGEIVSEQREEKRKELPLAVKAVNVIAIIVINVFIFGFFLVVWPSVTCRH